MMRKRVVLQRSWVKQRVHISWHIALAAVGVLIGIACAPKWGDIYAGNEWLIIVGSLATTVAIKQARYMLVIALIIGMVLGLWRGADRHQGLQPYASMHGTVQTVTGRVSEDTTFGPKGDLRIRVGDIMINKQQLPGTMWVSTQQTADIKRGDTIILSGLISEGFGNIPASMFRAKVESITRPQPGDVGRQARDWFAGGVHKAMPAEDADFALAFLVGQKLTISETLANQLKVVGLIHAVVASGYHLTVLIGLVRRLFVRVSKYLTALFSAGMISGFILITGFSPSMTRAGLVSGLSLVAWYYGRVIHPLVLLPFAAAITALYQPEYVWGDIGWYLSFAAFTGVIFLGPLLHHYFWGKNKRPGLLREVLVATFAAQLTTLPLTMYAFGYYSIYALLANALVVPLIPLTMLLTFISGALGLIATPIAPLAGQLVSWLLTYMRAIVGWIAGLPGSQSEISFNMLYLVFGYVLITLLVVFLWHRTGHNFRRDTEVQQDF